MIKKALNTAKATLLAATLLLTGLTLLPQMARAWTIDIYCGDSSSLCAIIDTPDFIVIAFGGLIGVDIY